MKTEILDRLAALRQQMAICGIDAAIIPQADPHQSEYLGSHWQVRRFLSGFTGSAGTLVVTESAALLWTDSRYFLQAADQLEGTGIALMKEGLSETPSIESYLAANLTQGMSVGIDGMLFSATRAEAMSKFFASKNIKLVTDFDVVDELWPNRPAISDAPVFIHDDKYAGETAKHKLADILADAKLQGAASALISALDEIVWALNIRSRDVKYNPVATSYLYVGQSGSILFINPAKVSAEVEKYLESQGVKIAPYDSIKDFVKGLSDKKVLIEKAKTSATICALLGSRAVNGISPIAMPKAIKNSVQIEGFRNAMVRDGVALVKALYQLDKMLAEGETVTELDVDALLLKYRSEQDLFFDESFGSIVGYANHGAIVHYEPTKESNATLQRKGLLLIDSGAQYLDGTTDITRTIALGAPTELEKHDFTLVLKGHIALSRVIFPVGTHGVQLDALARQYLWREGLGYLHGTGHGVGHFLNVHEGPQSIRLNYIPTVITPGMVTSNEPGLYREGIHGVRTENLVLCVPAMKTEFGEFLKFETLTLFPYDLSLFETEIMSQEEIDWVNTYHVEVREKLTPYLTPAEAAWLATKTRAFERI